MKRAPANLQRVAEYRVLGATGARLLTVAFSRPERRGAACLHALCVLAITSGARSVVFISGRGRLRSFTLASLGKFVTETRS